MVAAPRDGSDTRDPGGWLARLEPEQRTLVRRHLMAGWAGLVVFIAAGLALDAMHALKVDAYLDLRNATRRLMWTLGHAHGTLFSLGSIAFAWTASLMKPTGLVKNASRGTLAGLALMPLGFFLGGLGIQGGDPGMGVLLVPLGAGLMLFGTLCMALAVRQCLKA